MFRKFIWIGFLSTIWILGCDDANPAGNGSSSDRPAKDVDVDISDKGVDVKAGDTDVKVGDGKIDVDVE